MSSTPSPTASASGNPDAPATPMPLTGVKVVEIGQNLAGPYASQILAMLGADVIKIERPEGDDARGWGPPFYKGMACSFQAVNLNKRSIRVDLKNPASLRWLKELIDRSDVLIQNLRPGVMNSLGLDAASLRASNPRLIYCSLWAFGHTGPMHLKPGYEPIIQAFSGMFSVNGAETGPPSRVGPQVLDLGTGQWAALGCLAALLQRANTGTGCVVDTSLLETSIGWLSIHFASFNATHQQSERHRSGNPKVVVFQAFDTSDGEVVIAAANDRLFAKLVRELGHPEWAEDPRYATNALRVQNKAELIPRIQQVLRTATMNEWFERLEAIGVPCSPIHDMQQAIDHEQTRALGIVQPVPEVGLPLIGLPVSFDGVRPPIRMRAPELGEHDETLGVPRP